MDLNAFEYFLTVVDEMNFTRAAQRLYMTQQSLSGHIKRLEDTYHVQLFRRRPVLRLTPEGEAMVVFSRQILASTRSMTERFAELSDAAAESLVMGISHQRSSVFFPGIWSLYHPTHKNITIHLRERMTNQLLADLQSSRIDLMVGVDIPRTTNLEVIPLAQEGLHCILNELLLQEHFPQDWQQMLARYKKEGVDLLELKALPMVTVPPRNRLRGALDSLFNKNRCTPNIILETAEQGLIFQVACYGDALGVLNPLSLYDAFRTHRSMPAHCHFLKIQNMTQYPVQVAYRSDLDQPQYLLDLVEDIRQEFDYYSVVLQNNLFSPA